MQYLIIGFLVMLGAMAAVSSAPVILAVAIGLAKLMFVLLVVGAIAGLAWFIRAS